MPFQELYLTHLVLLVVLEMEHQNLGFDLLKKLTTEVEEYAKVEVAPKFEGRQIMMILVPQILK